MKRKINNSEISGRLSEDFLNFIEGNYYSKKFKMFLEGFKSMSSLNFIKHVYEFELKLDWSELIYCKYISNDNKVRFIFYSTIEDQVPVHAFEYDMDLNNYLDLIERILNVKRYLTSE